MRKRSMLLVRHAKKFVHGISFVVGYLARFLRCGGLLVKNRIFSLGWVIPLNFWKALRILKLHCFAKLTVNVSWF